MVVVARLYTLSSSSFFLSFFKVLLLLSLSLSLEKVSSLSFQRERERSMCVCVFGMDGDEIFETLAT